MNDKMSAKGGSASGGKQKLKKIFENTVWWSGVVMVGLIIGISLQVVKAWTEPTAVPPNGNVGAPINTGANQQWKGLGGTGSLALTGVLEAFGLKVDSKLDTAGNILSDVTGKFLAAKDASGQVAWAAAGGGGACYADYSLPAGTSIGADCGGGFTVKKSLGTWGYCCWAHNWQPLTDVWNEYTSFFPPGGVCPTSPGTQTTTVSAGEAYLCCQN